MFSTPKAYVKIDFNCPFATSSPEADVLTDLFTRLLMDYLNEYGRLYRMSEKLPFSFVKILQIAFYLSKGSLYNSCCIYLNLSTTHW